MLTVDAEQGQLVAIIMMVMKAPNMKSSPNAKLMSSMMPYTIV